ncbi:hypothetical protein H5410_046440, partial [Solanum commersonii]
PRNNSWSVDLTTVCRSDSEGHLVAWEARHFGQATAQTSWTTPRSVVLTTAHKSGCEASLAQRPRLAQPWPSTFSSPRTTSRPVALSTVSKSGCEGHFMARVARHFGQITAQTSRTTPRSVVLTMAR